MRHQKGWEAKLQISDLEVGDVLLAYSQMTKEQVSESTSSEYSHAAIYLGEGLVGEADVRGVKKSKIEFLLDSYDHISILRLNGYWGDNAAVRLNKLIDHLVDSNVGFDFDGIREFEDMRASHNSLLQGILEEFFSGGIVLYDRLRDSYFCSGLVVAAYSHVGIIQGGLRLVITPETMSPGDLIREPSFGSFVGYISRKVDYVMQESDDFYHEIMDVELPD